MSKKMTELYDWYGTIPEVIWQRFEEIFRESALSQIKFAKRICVTDTAVRNYLKKKRLPDILTIIKLSQEFDISLDYICGLSEEKRK